MPVEKENRKRIEAAMKLHLTDIAVRSLKPDSGRQFKVWDASTPGFGVLVGERSKSWIVMYGEARRLKVLGRYPAIPLSEARTEAKRILLTKAADTSVLKAITFKQAFDDFMADCRQRNRPTTVRDYERLITNHFNFRDRRLSDIAASDIVSRVSKLAKTPSEQRHALVAFKVFMSWCAKPIRGYLALNPAAAMQLPSKGGGRERVLKDAELAIVLAHARQTPFPFGPLIQLLIILGQRRGETAALQWDWIDEEQRVIALPSTITKNRREHFVPYGNMAAAVFEAIPRQGPYLFPATRDRIKGKPATIFNGWGKPKAVLDAAIKGDQEKSPVAPWTLHDLRRTASTTWAKLRIPQHINDRLLNHVSGSTSGVAAIYNRYEYLDEKREAILLWEQKLEALSE